MFGNMKFDPPSRNPATAEENAAADPAANPAAA
jgi:hypothetical protein